MSVTVKLNKSQIKKIEKKGMKSLSKLASEIIKDAPIPTDTGEMEKNITITSKGNSVTITHNEAYSKRQYFHPEYNHKNGKAEWFKEYINGSKSKFMIDTFTKNFK
jgi:hypothetical protein